MKSIEATLKLKRVLLFVGVSLLSLAFFGCGGGGGGGTLTNPATLQIGNGGNLNPSLSRVGGASRSLSAIGSGAGTSLTIYSLDGQQLEVQNPISTFPVTIELTGAKKSVAETQGVLVACLSDGTNEYRTIFKLNSQDLASNGPVQDGNGGIRTEDTDATTTVLASITESELSQFLGVTVRTCRELAGSERAAIAANVDKNEANSLPVDDLVELTAAAAKTTGSALNQLLSAVATDSTASATSGEIDAILNGTKADGSEASSAGAVQAAKNLLGATTKLLDAGKKSSSTVSTLADSILKATPAQADQASAAANATGAMLNLGKKTGDSDLSNAAASAVAGSFTDAITNLSGALEKAAETVDTNDPEQAENLGTVLGAALAGSTAGSSEAKAAQGALKLTLNLGEAANKVLGKALEGAKTNSSAVANVVNTALETGQDVKNAIKEAGAESRTLIAKAINENTTEKIEDSITIKAPASVSLTQWADIREFGVRAETTLTRERYNQNTIFATDRYSIDWSTSGAGSSLGGLFAIGRFGFGSSNGVIFTSAGTITLRADLKYDGVIVASDTVQIPVADFPPPTLHVSETSVTLRAGGTKTVYASATNNRNSFALFNSITPTAIIGSGTGCATAVSGLRIAPDTNDIIFLIGNNSFTITANSAVPSSKAYCAKFTASDGTNTSEKVVNVEVLGIRPTTVIVTPVVDQAQGATVELKATALHDSSTTGNIAISVTGAGTGSNTATLSGSLTSVTTTLANLVAGTYTVTGTATGSDRTVSDSTTFQVNPPNAPTNLAVQVDDIAVATGDSVNKTTSGSTFVVDIDVSATGAESFMAWSGQVSDSNSTGQNLSLALPLGTNMVTVSASNSDGVSAQMVFDVIVKQVRDIEVTHVTLMGTIVGSTTVDAASNASGNTTALSTSVAGGIYMVNAGNVTGLNLDTVQGDMLMFNIYTETPNSADVSQAFDIEVSMTQENSNRLASLQVSGATIAESSGGWDVTSATSFFFSGTKNSGESAQVQVSSIATLDALFESTTNGIMLDLLGLRDAMKSILTDNGNVGFVSVFDSLAGSGITVEVTVTSPNFSFTSGGESFNTFKIWNISVD